MVRVYCFYIRQVAVTERSEGCDVADDYVMCSDFEDIDFFKPGLIQIIRVRFYEIAYCL